MRILVSAVRASNAANNPYAALALALALPDICASLEASDGRTNGDRYAAWWNEYVGPAYRRPVGADHEIHVFMTGGDCYALRCAFLHQGLDDVTAHKARIAIDKFHFVQPPQPGWQIHCNQSGPVLNLQVDIFTEQICAGVETWLQRVGSRSEVTARIAGLVTINDVSDGLHL